MTLQIKEMNLFDAPRGTILVHACNCQGAWNSGIASEFKLRFPRAYKHYNAVCASTNPPNLLGDSLVIKDDDYHIGCLFTSLYYGKRKGSMESILLETESALDDFCTEIIWRGYPRDVYSNEFNSGLFQVPWEESEKVLKRILSRFPSINWTVCKFKG